MPRIASAILKACHGSAFMKETFVVRPWMQATNSLLTLIRCNALQVKGDMAYVPARLDEWRELGKGLGIDEVARRREEAERAKLKMGGLVGCCWFRCPMFGSKLPVPERRMMACSKCKTVGDQPLGLPLCADVLFQAQYCDFHCQRS